MDKYVKIFRFDDQGFFCKPANSDVFPHTFKFIDTEIKDLYKINQSISTLETHRPEKNDCKWSGCFCFLEEYDKNLLTVEGGLSIRRNAKMNVALIPMDSIIWVRNTSHLGKDYPFFNEFTYVTEEKEEYELSETPSVFDHLRWVKMRVDLALERTRLWKEREPNYLPEWITEFYLMEEQIKTLSRPLFKDRAYLFLKNKKIIGKS
ncbi:hypothetical protein [Priestia megaterium]|uniref:hypothetical protein n=1 Tax=Priestia megaterium TaxID=1404 RepID=UPI002E21CE7E|nr:hypothetical protein [Priestia megaterium]